MVEEWRLTKFDGYLVSSLGRVKGATGKIMKGTANKVTGYLQITITANRSDTSKQRKLAVHVLTCLAFHGPPPEGMEVRHLDGNKLNNRAENLAWGTHFDNGQDRIIHGTTYPGEKAYNARLTNSQAREIRRRALSGLELQDDIGADFGVNKACVSAIKLGRNYRNA